MFCSNCGKELVQDAKFCPSCGEKVLNSVAQDAATVSEWEKQAAAADGTAQSTPASSGDAQAASASSSDGQAASASVTPGATQASTASSGASHASEAPNVSEAVQLASNSGQQGITENNSCNVEKSTETVYSESCFGAAWRDVKESDAWFGKMLLLALIQMVPILNFSSIGYTNRWAADVAAGHRYTLPSVKIGPYFKSGFFLFIFAIIYYFALCVASGILGVVPILGQLAAAALAFMSYGFFMLANIRIVLKDSLGGGFDLKDIWNAYTKKLGTLICNGVLSNVVFQICAGIVIGIVCLILVLLAGGAFSYIYIYGADIASYMSTGTLFLAFILILIFGYVVSAICLLGDVLSMRAVGHYIKRHASEWKNESKMPVIPDAQV